MPLKELSNEVKLMFYCARTKIDISLKCQIQELLRAPLDWSQIIEQSHYHGIAPLVYYNLNNFNKSNIPEEVFNILRNSYYATLARNLYLWREFCLIQDRLSNAGIKIIPLKGIILSETFYHNLGLRPMVDIDILIQEKDLFNAKNELLQLGYKIYLKDLPEDYWRKYHCHFQFCNPDKNIIFELHWALAPPRPNKIDISELWQRSSIQSVGHSKVLVLTYEDILLSLYLHMCKNISSLQYIKLKNLCDIHELISQYGERLDWDYILNKIASWRLKGCFFYLYLLTKTYLGTRWPPEIISKIKLGSAQRATLNFFIPNIQRKSRFQASLLMLAMLDTTADCFILILQRIAMIFQKINFAISASRHDKQR